jgi:hypothetical protein
MNRELKLLIVENVRSCEQDKEMLHVNGFLSEFRARETLQIHAAGLMSSHDSPEARHMIRTETFFFFLGGVSLISESQERLLECRYVGSSLVRASTPATVRLMVTMLVQIWGDCLVYGNHACNSDDRHDTVITRLSHPLASPLIRLPALGLSFRAQRL